MDPRDVTRLRLQAIGRGGHMGLRAYEDAMSAQRQRVSQAEADFAGDNTLFNNEAATQELSGLMNRHMTPYSADLASGVGLAQDSVGYQDAATRSIQSDIDQRLSRMQQERDARRALVEAERAAREAALGGGGGGGYDPSNPFDMSVGAQQAAVRGRAQELWEGGRTDYTGTKGDVKAAGKMAADRAAKQMRPAYERYLAEHSARFDPVLAAEQRMAAAYEQRFGMPATTFYDQAAFAQPLSFDEWVRSQETRGVTMDGPVPVVSDPISAARAAAIQQARAEQAALSAQYDAAQPLAMQGYAEQAMLEAGYDPYVAAGYAANWFDPASELSMAEGRQAAENFAMFGNPDGELGAMQAAIDEAEAIEEYNRLLLADSLGLGLGELDATLSDAEISAADFQSGVDQLVGAGVDMAEAVDRASSPGFVGAMQIVNQGQAAGMSEDEIRDAVMAYLADMGYGPADMEGIIEDLVPLYGD